LSEPIVARVRDVVLSLRNAPSLGLIVVKEAAP
jgi:hypothetical protein